MWTTSIRPALARGDWVHLRSLHRCHARLPGRRARRDARADRAAGAARCTAELHAGLHAAAGPAGRRGLARARSAQPAAPAIASRTRRWRFFERVRAGYLRAGARRARSASGSSMRRAPPRCERRSPERSHSLSLLARHEPAESRCAADLAELRRAARSAPRTRRAPAACTADPRGARRRRRVAGAVVRAAGALRAARRQRRAAAAAAAARVAPASTRTSSCDRPGSRTRSSSASSRCASSARQLALTSHQGGYKVGILFAGGLAEPLRRQCAAEDAGGAAGAHAADPRGDASPRGCRPPSSAAASGCACRRRPRAEPRMAAADARGPGDWTAVLDVLGEAPLHWPPMRDPKAIPALGAETRRTLEDAWQGARRPGRPPPSAGAARSWRCACGALRTGSQNASARRSRRRRTSAEMRRCRALATAPSGHEYTRAVRAAGRGARAQAALDVADQPGTGAGDAVLAAALRR